MDVCKNNIPQLEPVAAGHEAACYLHQSTEGLS
jgi:hypothetical protein